MDGSRHRPYRQGIVLHPHRLAILLPAPSRAPACLHLALLSRPAQRPVHGVAAAERAAPARPQADRGAPLRVQGGEVEARGQRQLKQFHVRQAPPVGAAGQASQPVTVVALPKVDMHLLCVAGKGEGRSWGGVQVGVTA